MISLLDTTSDSSTVPANPSESAAPDSTVPFAIPVPETESAFATRNAESDTAAQRAMNEKRLIALQSVCLLDRDAKFRERVPEDLYYMISDRALSDRAGLDLLIGDEFARTVSNEDVYGALELFIEQAPADKQPQMRERLRGCKTEADGKRLLGSMFREKAEKEWADSQARIAHLNELNARAQHVLRDRLKGDLSVVLPTAEEENELSATLSSLFENADDRRGFERACEAMALIRAQQSKKHKVFIHSDMPFVSSEVVEEDSYNEGNLLQLRDRLLDYVLDGNKEIDQYALKWLREGLGGFAAELKAKDPNAAKRFAVSLTQMIGNVKNFVQDADAEETSWSLIQAVPGLALPTGPNEMWTPDQYDNAVEVAPVALKRRQEELAAEDPMRAKRLLLAGEINNALTEGLAMPDEASWWEQAYKGAAQMAPQTLPWLLPYVGMPLGAATAYTSESQRGYATGIANFQRAHGRMPNPYEQAGLSLRANQDALLGAAVEVLPGQAVGVPFTRWMSKLTSVRGPAGTLSRIVSRLGERRAAAVGMDIAAGVAEEAVFEPVAQGLLTMGTDAMLDMAGIQGVNRRTVGEAFSELQENYENPGQLGAIVLTVAVLGGGKLPSTLHTADMLREQNNLLRAAGLSEEGVAQVRSSDDPLKTARELWQKESADDQNAVLARIRREAAQNKTTGDLLKRTGLVTLANRSEQEAAKASYDFLVEQGLMPKVEEKLDGTFHITEEVGGEGGSVRTKEYDFDAATADAYIAMRAIGANKVLIGAKQALVWGLQDSYIKEIYGEAAAQSIAKQGGKHGIFIREVEEIAGMTPELAEEARTNRFAMTAEWMKKAAATLHDSSWAQRAESFRQRLEMEGLEADESGTRLFRERSDRQVQVGGKDVFGSILTYVRGQATASDAVEDVFEAVTDMMIQSRAMELLEEDSNMGTQRALQIAVREMADSVRPIIREMALLNSDHSISELAKEKNWTDENLYMTTVESLSHIAKSNFLAKRDQLPAAFQSGIDAAANALDYTYEMKQFADAYAAVAKGSKEQIAPLEDLLAKQGVIVQDVFREAAVDEQVTASWKKAKGLMGRKSAVDGTGALGVTEAMEQAEQTETEIAEHEAEKAAAPPATADEEASWGDRMKEAATIAEQTPAATAPAEMMGVFRHDACVYNGAAGFYEGWVKVSDLKDSVEIQQVKVGNKGKHGVTNELVGDFQLSAPPIIVWRRLNGDLEVISGRHRYALAEKCNVEHMRADVYQESDVFDARWARLMDYENNMRDDQADEKTAFIYVRETGFTDEELNRKGLLRSRTKSKRGAMIARYAREELATRFMNDAVTPMDAEIICNMTRNIRDEERIEEIQRRACMLLDEHKSWEYIGAMVQLMASKESVFMKQGLLDFGVDFEADLARAAKYIEICTKQLNEAIGVMRSGRKLAGKQAKLAHRLGQLTTSAEDTQERLDALTTMKGMFENIGMFPDLVSQAQMWDGESEIDAVGMALDRGLREVQQDEVLDGMSVEERLEAAEQEAARMAAQEATGNLFSFSVADMRKTRVRLSAKDVAEMSAMPNLRMDVDNLDQVYEMAKAGMDDIRNAIESVGRDLGLFVKMRNSLKGRERANYKVLFDYKGDAGKLLDVYGGTIVLQPGDSFTDVIEAVKAKGLEVVRVKNLYADASKYGYADIKLNLRTRHGFIGELILIEQHMMEVKGEVGHLIYEVGRKIDQAIDSEADSAKTARLKALQEALAHYSQGLYQGSDYNDMKELRKRALDACQETQSKLNDYVSAELPELEAVLGKLQQSEEYYSTRAQNSFSVASRNSYGRLSYEGFTGKDQSSYLVPSSDFSSRYQLPHRTFPHTLSVSRSFVNRKKSILETASRNSSRVSNEVNIDNSPVSQGEEKSKNNFAKSASSAEEVEGILPLRTWEGWLQFEPDENDAGGVEREGAQSGSDGLLSSFSLAQQLDDDYMAALRRGDEETAHRLVLEAAKASGYIADSNYQGSKAFNGRAPGQNGYFETEQERYNAWKNGEFEDTITLEDFVRNGIDPTNLKWQISDEGAYIRAEDYTRESIDAIRAAKASRSNTITIYRAVPKSVKEKSARNGDWVTLSEAYAKLHITLQDWDGARIIKQTVPMEHVWWDGNDINEWGYDDGKEYAYRNTANNRKSLATVTYDANRNIIPLSQRFNPRKSSVSFSLTGKLTGKTGHASFSHVDVPANGVVKTAKEAREILKPLQGRVFTNKNTGISAIIQARLSRQTIGKVGASQMSVSNLKPFGYSREQAQQIHHTAAVHIHELFENAEDAFLEEAYKEEGDRAGVYHFFNTIHIEGVGSFDVNVMAVKQKRKEQGNFLYALELTIENPQGYDSESGLRKQVSTIHASRAPKRKLASYRSFVEKEMRGIKEKSQEEGTFMKAPNGKPTNLTERQWLTVRTQAFKNWFGDWENAPEDASKVVDENGEPKVVYHNSGKRRNVLSREFSRKSMDIESVCFAPESDPYGEYGPYEHAVFLRILTPADYDTAYTEHGIKLAVTDDAGVKIREWLQDRGYDGVIEEEDGAPFEYKVFESTQIKSATDNRGTFDPAAPDITFSALTASQRREAVQKELALIAVKDEQIAALASDWERMLQDLNKVSRAGESVGLGDGARLYAELLSLISATRAILPPHLAQMGRLNLLMHWAAAYAEMVQHGDLPMRGGAMKGAVAEKFLSAMRKQRDALLLQGLSEEEAREAMAQLGAERLDRSLRKVAVACRDQLNRYVKEQAWERIESIRKRTMPKSEPGHRSKKGKMDSDHYRTMGEIMRALRMTEEQMDEEYQAVVAQMQALTGTEEDYEKRHEKLQDALNILTTYGCWQAMSSAQALKAAESFAEFVATGRNSWKSELDKRKRKNRWMMRRMTENMRKQATPAAVNKEQNKDATGVWRTIKRAALDYIYGLMNFSHLIQAKTRQLGSSMVVRLQDMLLQAQEGKHRETSRRNMMLSMKLREIFGCTSEADAVRVLNELGRQREDHGLRAWKREWQTYTLDREEAEAWVSMTPAERNAVRQRERQEAESQQMVPPDRVPESEMEQLRAVLDEMNNRTRTLSNGESKPSPSKAKTVKLTVKRWGEKAEAETLKVSRLAVANNLLLLEQPGYTSLLEDWGIIRRDARGCELTPGTPEFVTGYDLEATLKPYYDFVGEECMEFCYWMRDYVAEYVTPLTNEAYNRRMGVPLRLLPLYWPGNFNISTMKDTDLLTDQSGGVLGQAASFTINRVRKHHAQADWNTNALSVFYRATDEQLNYVYVGELTQELRNMFMNDGFVKTLEVNCGVQWVRAVKDQINILDNCVGIEAVNMEAMGKVLARFFGQLAKDALAFNPKSYTKQASGILNGLTAGLVPRSVIERSDGAKELAYSKIGVMEWAQSLGKVMLGKGKVRLEAMQRREFWQQRYNMSRVEERVRKASTLRSARQSVHAGVIADTGMRVMGAIDRAANIPGLLALADTFYSRLEALNKQHALGMTPAQIEQQALDAVGRALDVGAQPITPEQRASMLATGRGLSKVMLNVATMFKSEIFKDLAQLASQWMSGQWGAAALHYAMRGTFNYGVVCLLWQLSYGGDDDKEDEEWMEAAGKYVLAALSSDLTAVPLLGELPNQLYSYASGTGSWHSTPLVGDISMAYKSSVRLARKGDEMDMQEIMRHSKRILRGLALLSVPFGFGQSRWGSFSDVALDASVIMNSVKVGADVYAAQTK